MLRPPFNEVEIRRQLLESMNAIDRIDLPPDVLDRYPNRKTPGARAPGRVEASLQALDWFVQLGDDQSFRLLIHDRDRKFSGAFDQVFRSEGVKVIRTPIQAPNANAYAERWVRTVRADCLDRLLILGRRHLEHVLRVYRRHYNEHRPHRALNLLPPDGRPVPLKRAATERLRRRDLLGGLIHEYEAAA